VSIIVDQLPGACVQSYIMSSYPQLERVYTPFSPRTPLPLTIPWGYGGILFSAPSFPRFACPLLRNDF
jgi:hypothetical protein